MHALRCCALPNPVSIYTRRSEYSVYKKHWDARFNRLKEAPQLMLFAMYYDSCRTSSSSKGWKSHINNTADAPSNDLRLPPNAQLRLPG